MPGEADSNWELQPLKVILRRGLKSNALDPTPAAETLLLKTKIDLLAVDGEARNDLTKEDQEPIVLSSPMSLPSPIAPIGPIAPEGTHKETVDAACQVNEVSPPATAQSVDESNNTSTSQSTLTVPPPPPPSPSPSLPPPSPPSESLLLCESDTEGDEDEGEREEDTSNDEDMDGSPAPDESSASESLNETAGTIPPLPPPTKDGAVENENSGDATQYSSDGFDSISSSGED